MNRDQLREAVLGAGAWNKAGIKLNESVEAPAQEVIEEAAQETEELLEEGLEEGHACPLCHALLEEAITDERLLEHAHDFIEALTEAGLLEEAEEEEDDDEAEAIEEKASCDDEKPKMVPPAKKAKSKTPAKKSGY